VDVIAIVVSSVVIELDVEVAKMVVVAVESFPATGDVTMQEHASEIKDGRRFTVRELEQTQKGGEGDLLWFVLQGRLLDLFSS
jgi:hypothetical protein